MPVRRSLKHVFAAAGNAEPKSLTFRSDRRGSVSLLGVLALLSLIGTAAFAVELGQGYRSKISLQGPADAAALAAANAYVQSPDDAVLAAAAKDVALANGILPQRVTVRHITGYSATISDVVQVTITTSIPLHLARIFTPKTSYDVTVASIASLPSRQAPPCILALAPSNGVTLSGGTSVSASNCALLSNGPIAISGGSTISAKAVTSSGDIGLSGGSGLKADTITYGGSLTNAGGSSVTGRQVKATGSTPDPLANNSALAAAFSRLGSYTAPRRASVPTGDDLSLSYYPTTMTFQGKTGTLSDGTWTFPAGEYHFANLNTGSLKLNIQGPSVVTVSGSVTVGGGGGLMLPDGPVTINAPVALSGGTTLTVGAGRHYFGSISLGGGSTATIGAGDMDVAGAILVDGGGSRLTVGAGNYAIGNDGKGTAIGLSGGSEASFGDGAFSANGAVKTAGGSNIVFGATGTHYINGDLDLNGGSTFGSGTYLINGGFTNNTGGTMAGRDVSFILAGTLKAAGGTAIALNAPSSGSSFGIADILFATRSSATTTLGGGTQDAYSGIIYAPNSDFRMSGGASIGGGCFSLVAKTVTLSGGPSAATACASMSAGGNSGNVGLVR